MLSYYVIISNHIACFTVIEIPQTNYGQFIILSTCIEILSILGLMQHFPHSTYASPLHLQICIFQHFYHVWAKDDVHAV